MLLWKRNGRLKLSTPALWLSHLSATGYLRYSHGGLFLPVLKAYPKIICTFFNHNVSRVYPYDFTYTLKATLCDSDGNPVTMNDSTFANYSIKTITDRTVPTYGTPVSFAAQTVEGQTNYIATIEGNSLTGGSTDEDYFLITFDDGQKGVAMPTFYVKLEAILDEEGEDIEDLAGYVGLYATLSALLWRNSNG